MLEGGSIAGLGIEAGLGFGGGVPAQGRVRVRVWSQEAPGAKPTAGQWSPRRAELRVQGTVPVRIRFGCQGNTRRSAPGLGGLWNPLRQLQPGLKDDMESFQVPCRVSLHRF